MVDDSRSMAGVAPLAVASLATLSGALNRLEVGQLAVTSFSDHLDVLHPFGPPFDDEAGAAVVEKLMFRAEGSALGLALQQSIHLFEEARATKSVASSTVVQICFVVSDARLDSDNRESLKKIIRELAEMHVLVVLVIIDKGASSRDMTQPSAVVAGNKSVSDDFRSDRDSIFNTKTVEFTPTGIITRDYLDDFPFPYYIAIRGPEALPELLADALKQWFELVRGQLDGNA